MRRRLHIQSDSVRTARARAHRFVAPPCRPLFRSGNSDDREGYTKVKLITGANASGKSVYLKMVSRVEKAAVQPARVCRLAPSSTSRMLAASCRLSARKSARSIASCRGCTRSISSSTACLRSPTISSRCARLWFDRRKHSSSRSDERRRAQGRREFGDYNRRVWQRNAHGEQRASRRAVCRLGQRLIGIWLVLTCKLPKLLARLGRQLSARLRLYAFSFAPQLFVGINARRQQGKNSRRTLSLIIGAFSAHASRQGERRRA